MGKVLIVVVVLAVALGVGDVQARHYAERRIAQRVRTTVAASGVHVAISSFPFLGRLAASGTVSRIQIRAVNVTSGVFAFDSVVLTARGLKLDRGGLLRGRLKVQGLGGGTVTADMTGAEVDHALATVHPGAHVTLGAGVVQVSGAGAVAVTGHVSVVSGQLRVDTVGGQVSVPVPQLTLVPCVPDATVTPGHLTLSCAFHQVPAALLTQAAAA